MNITAIVALIIGTVVAGGALSIVGFAVTMILKTSEKGDASIRAEALRDNERQDQLRKDDRDVNAERVLSLTTTDEDRRQDIRGIYECIKLMAEILATLKAETKQVRKEVDHLADTREEIARLQEQIKSLTKDLQRPG